MKVEIVKYDALTDEERMNIPNNERGIIKFASYLRVTHLNETIALESDAMEPEDCTFFRDLSWIKPLLEKCHALGQKKPS